MIPKVIHYCWFGGAPKPALALKCIASWKKYCPDYEIKEWDESNFDVNCNVYCQEMHRRRKWAFLSDYARLKIIYENGGIYLDTDVELVKSLDSLLNDKSFMGSEYPNWISTGLGFGAEKNHDLIKKNMAWYENWKDGDKTEVCSKITTDTLKKYGFTEVTDKFCTIEDIVIYPKEFFCPKNYMTEIIEKTENTYSIHHYSASWFSKEDIERDEKIRSEVKKHLFRTRILHFFFGKSGYNRVINIWRKIKQKFC